MGKASKKKKREKTVVAPENTTTVIQADEASFALPGSVLLHIALLSVIGLMVYSNTFGVPFQFDDYYTVIENPATRKLSNVPAMLAGLKGAWASRPLLQATLAINFHLGEFETWSYHAVNIAFHIINGILLYLLVVMTGRHLEHTEKDIRPLALCSALLFVAHPVQTDAVTYIVSRSMLFATTFYLLGMILFLKAVTSEKRRHLYMAGLFIVSLLGMASRENFTTFPAMLVLYDLFFISRFSFKDAVKHYKVYLPVLLSLGYFVHLLLNNTYDRQVDYPTMNIPAPAYALTQFKVHWTYLRLLILPVNQNLDYDYPVSKSLLELPTLLSFAGYFGLWAAGLSLARKRPYLAFSVLWFLVALLPVSFGVTLLRDLELNDVIFEHRLYLPSVAFFPLAAAGIFRLGGISGANVRKVLVISLAAFLTFVLSTAAFTRNMVWRSEISQWEDVVSKSPGKARGHNELGIAYASEGMFDKAMEHLNTALKLEPGDAYAYNNLGIVYQRTGFSDKAIEHYKTAIRLKPDYAEAYNNLGGVYGARGLLDEAIEYFETSARLKPDFALARFNLGLAYFKKGNTEKARSEFEAALRIDPGQHRARKYLNDIAGQK